jgi:hypothetical protein
MRKVGKASLYKNCRNGRSSTNYITFCNCSFDNFDVTFETQAPLTFQRKNTNCATHCAMKVPLNRRFIINS